MNLSKINEFFNEYNFDITTSKSYHNRLIIGKIIHYLVLFKFQFQKSKMLQFQN